MALLVAFSLDQAFLIPVGLLQCCSVKDVPGGPLDLRREIVELGAVPDGAAPLELESLELVDLVQQPSGSGVKASVARPHIPTA